MDCPQLLHFQTTNTFGKVSFKRPPSVLKSWQLSKTAPFNTGHLKEQDQFSSPVVNHLYFWSLQHEIENYPFAYVCKQNQRNIQQNRPSKHTTFLTYNSCLPSPRKANNKQTKNVSHWNFLDKFFISKIWSDIHIEFELKIQRSCIWSFQMGKVVELKDQDFSPRVIINQKWGVKCFISLSLIF